MRRVLFFAMMLGYGVIGVLPNTGTVPAISGSDLVLHFAGWIAGALCGRWAFPLLRSILLGTGLWGWSLAIEVGQLFVPTRSFELADLVANALGVFAGLWLARVVITPSEER